jgi:hypothetical protein
MHRHTRGFTLLLSILVISMILSVSLGITSIVIKENQLSALVRESEAAFHAADKGIDCALFYHISYDRNVPPLLWSPFPTSTIGSSFNYPLNYLTATCDGDQIQPLFDTTPPEVPAAPNGTSAYTKFRMTFADGSCVDVRVYNYNSGVDSTITSEGYNTCDINSPRRTLRVIEVTTNL